MGRCKQAPCDFQCPYRDACPHLNGISTTWACLIIDDKRNDTYRSSHFSWHAENEIAALRADQARLEKENAELRARLKAKHTSRFKPNRQTPRDSGKRRKRGAPKGHPPWNRKPPDHIDRTIVVSPPTTCPHCSTTDLQPTGEKQDHLQEDIVLQPKTFVTRYVHETAFCPCCRRPVFQTAEGELRNCPIGPTTKATAVFLRQELKLSMRSVRKIFQHLFSLDFVPASAMAFEQKSASLAQPIHEQLRDKVRSADIIHADETHWRIDGKNAFIWYAGNSEFGFFHIDPSRSGQVALDIFGSNFQGNLVADDYAAYNVINARNRQSCLAHLLRKAKEIHQLISALPKSQQHPPDLIFCERFKALLVDACDIGRRRDTGKISFTHAKALIPSLRNRLLNLSKKTLHHPEAENLRQRVLDPKRDYHRLFTFLKVNRMPPTNNYAEQTLRHPVIFRKIVFGNRSTLGAHTMGINLSIINTIKCRNLDPIPLIKNLFLNGHLPLANALFCNSS